MKISSSIVASVGAICASGSLMAGGGDVFAQGAAGMEAPPALTRVATIQVKPDMLGAWLDLQRNEAVPALKKAGVPWRWVFSNGGPVGPGFTYTIVQPVDNYARFDSGPSLRRGLGDQAYARYLDKERTMLVANSAIVQVYQPDASLRSPSGTPPALAIVTTSQLRPLKGPEWSSITTSEVLPALKKAGVTDYWVFATSFGGRLGQRTIVQPLTKWADLDAPNPLVRALGADGARQLNQKRADLLEGSSAVSVVTYVPDVSFGTSSRR